MSRVALRAMVDGRAFNPTPSLNDLGEFHVPFDSMTGNSRVEGWLSASARRGDRVALIAESGGGKSSLVSYTLGPMAEHVAPIVVPVHSLEREAGRAKSVADAIIAQLRLQADDSRSDDAALKTAAGGSRLVTSMTSRRRGGSVGIMGWLSGDLSHEIGQQTATQEQISLTAKVDVIRQCLQGIRLDGLEPVFVFDDTDRWSSPSDELNVTGFFGEGIRWLAELPASVVVATHARYLDTSLDAAELLSFLDTRVEIPRLPSVEHLARILDKRVLANACDPEAGPDRWSLSEVVDRSAVEALYEQYARGVSLRRVLQLAHIALVEASDAGAEKIDGYHISAATQA